MSKRNRRTLTIVGATVLLGAALAIGFYAPAASGNAAQLLGQLDGAPYADRFDIAASALLAAADSEVVALSVAEILSTSKQLALDSDALGVLDQFLAARSESSPGYHDAYYARARILHRGADKSVAEAFFRDGISRGWTRSDRTDPFDAFKDSLWRSDPLMYPVEMFNHAMADPTGSVYATAGPQQRGDHLSIFGIDLMLALIKKCVYSLI